MAKQPLIAANWKMHKTVEETEAFLKELPSMIQGCEAQVYIAPPFTALQAAVAAVKGTGIKIGAQNMHDASEGAFTGEIAAPMLKELGVEFVILGHSERRHLFGEESSFVNKKVHKALAEGLLPIVCIGETEAEREKGETEEVLQRQLTESLEGVTEEQMEQIVLAYEPVWAIGTGKTATPELAQEAHKMCRKWLKDNYSASLAKKITIQYGGSVKAENIAALLAQPDIDGALVGGASLNTHSFASMVGNIHEQVS